MLIFGGEELLRTVKNYPYAWTFPLNHTNIFQFRQRRRRIGRQKTSIDLYVEGVDITTVLKLVLEI